MSIFPSTDIVSDVARAADPLKRDVALRRLNEMGAEQAAAGRAFAAMVDAPKRQSSATQFARATAQGAGLAARAQPSKSPEAVAAQKFEAFILQSWLEVLLPKEEGGSYGSGGAANVWRSMMAEQLGAQVARSGGIGLHKMIEKTDHASDFPRAPASRRA